MVTSHAENLRTLETSLKGRPTAMCNLRESKNELAQIHVGNNACYFCMTLLVPRYTFFFSSEEERSQFASSCFLLIILLFLKSVLAERLLSFTM